MKTLKQIREFKHSMTFYDVKSAEAAEKKLKTFKLKGNIKKINLFLKNLTLFKLAESLGGVESLVGHPATMTHASLSENQRNDLGITENLLRLSVGIEDCDDLIEDLERSIRAID